MSNTQAVYGTPFPTQFDRIRARTQIHCMSQPTLSPQEFAAKWGRASLRERQAVQEHFIDLCRLIGHPTPAEDDPAGERFTFEAGATKTGGGQGWADVWKRGCFAWEYKGKDADLDKAYRQLLHRALDAAVLDAYGWPHDLSDEDILARLLALNLERAGAA